MDLKLKRMVSTTDGNLGTGNLMVIEEKGTGTNWKRRGRRFSS